MKYMNNPTCATSLNLEVVLNLNLSVPKPFYDRIKELVEEVLPALERGEYYSLKMLCGGQFWESVGDGDRRRAGQCMAYMVRNNEIPSITFAPTKREYPIKYMLI